MIKISDNTFPCFFTLADRQAIKSQKQYLFVLKCSIWLIIGASMLAYIRNFIGLEYVDWLIGVLLLINLLLNWWIQAEKMDNLWYDYRSIAESIKTLTWKFMLKVAPFIGNESNCTKEFRRRVTKILNSKMTLHKSHAISANQQFITNDMRSIRQCDLQTRALIYTQYRIQDQADWYEKKSKYNKKMGTIFFICYMLFNFLLLMFIVISIWKSNGKELPLDLFMVLVTSIQTWTQIKKYSDLANSYALTTQEIALIKEEKPQFNTEQEFSRYVSDCENAFSREHTQWYARKQS